MKELVIMVVMSMALTAMTRGQIKGRDAMTSGALSKWMISFGNHSAPLPAPTPKVQTEKRLTRTSLIFVFHADEFWLNLHHFLYVLGRAENKEANASRAAVAKAPADADQGLANLTANEKAVWREAGASYAATLSKKDLVFDDPLPDITNALAQAGDARSLAATQIDPSVASILERAAPIYRKAWSTKHRDANLGVALRGARLELSAGR